MAYFLKHMEFAPKHRGSFQFSIKPEQKYRIPFLQIKKRDSRDQLPCIFLKMFEKFSLVF
jgi:hypothetical protein